MTALDKGNKYVMNTYSRFPVIMEKGEGMYLFDEQGKKYLDFVAGIAVNSLGHSNKKITARLTEQAALVMHTSNLYYTKPQTELAEKLITGSCFDKAFFCNSGAEAVEAAVKLARKYGSSSGRYRIIAMQGSFHGRTLGALSVTGQSKYQNGFAPLLPGIIHVPFNDFEAVKNVCGDETCGIILEPIQGEGGIIPAQREYLQNIRKLCWEKDIVLIFDEVQCGIGRTGDLFAYSHFGAEPDVVSLAKGLGGGFPIGAMLAVEKIAAAFSPGDHASTFGGNPLAASVASLVIDEVGLILENIKQSGEYLTKRLNEIVNNFPQVAATRGIGLMQCIKLDSPVSGIIAKCMDRGLLLISSGVNIIRFVPPLIVEKHHIDDMANTLSEVLKNEY